MALKYIEYEVENRIGYITLNRPEKRNAFNETLVAELKGAFKLAARDTNVKVIVLRANGAVFSAGADLEALRKMQNNTYDENLKDSYALMELFSFIYRLPKVVIAQVEGHAIAGGSGLATVCDICFSVPEAKFGYTEVQIGFIPAIVSVFLLRKIGETKAKQLLLTGDLITAQEACDMGIINFVESKERIAVAVKKFAEKLCKTASGTSLGLTKNIISETGGMNIKDALKYASELNARARATDDCKRGVSAFLNRQKLIW